MLSSVHIVSSKYTILQVKNKYLNKQQLLNNLNDMLVELHKTFLSIYKRIEELDIKNNFKIECVKVRFKCVHAPFGT